jgi:hypothetical protein
MADKLDNFPSMLVNQRTLVFKFIDWVIMLETNVISPPGVIISTAAPVHAYSS